MNELTKLLIASSLAGALSITGCGSESTPHSSAEHSEDYGHDHSDNNETGHQDHDQEDGNHSNHGIERSLGSVVIAGSTLRVSFDGELMPNATLHMHIEHTAGLVPAEIRLWIGAESGEASLKSRATGSGSEYHADLEVSAELASEDALWIEIETFGGERVLGFVTLN